MTIGKKLYVNFGIILIMVVALFLVNLLAVNREHSAKELADTTASTDDVAGHRRADRPRPVMPGCAIRHSPMSITSCERCARSPATPSASSRNP